MTSNRKPSGSIHKIREFELEKVNLADEFDILQIVGEGWFGKILLVEHRATDTEMVLKALPKPYVSLRDFYREFHYGLHLGVHKNIVTTYDVAFETAGFYVFSQEYAPLGDLTSNVLETGIGETHTKRVAKQIASALDFMHSKELVHRDVKLDNVLVCRSDFSRVKLCDFGESRKTESLVHRRNEWLPYSPPEVLCIKTDDTYKALPTHDIWQFGIVIFVCLTGCLPWQKAASDDPRYIRYISWQSSSMVIPIKRTPKLFKLISSRCCKLFRKILEPNQDRRPKNLNDVQKFLDDRWLAKGAEKDMLASEPDELCPSMYSFHSNPEEKNKLLSTLVQHGIEVTVDRVAKKNRIRDWIQSSVITEEDEDEDSGTATPSSIQSVRAPVAGHISSLRALEQNGEKKIVTTIRDASNKHIDPRTGIVQTGPSEMVVKNNTVNNNNQNNNGHSANGYDNHNNSPKPHRHRTDRKSPNHQHQQQHSVTDKLDKRRKHVPSPPPQQQQQQSQQKFKMKTSKTNNNNNPPVIIGNNSSSAAAAAAQLTNSSSSYYSIENSDNHLLDNAILENDNQYQQHPAANLGKSTTNTHNHKYEQRSISNKDLSLHQNENQFTPAFVAQTIQKMTDNLIKNNQIMDSGYGSLDKLKFDNTIINNSHLPQSQYHQQPINQYNNQQQKPYLGGGTGGLSASPILTKRSTIKASPHDYIEHDDYLLSDQILYDSDIDHYDNDQHGSNGFVHTIGLSNGGGGSTSNNRGGLTMKDTAYDRIKLKKKVK